MLNGEKGQSRPWVALIIIVTGFVAILLTMAISVSVGVANVRLGEVWQAIFQYDPNIREHQIIQTLRLPRVIAGAIVGVCFAVSGAMMQGITHNPLADSSLLGINAGAALTLSICFVFYKGLSFNMMLLCTFIGATIGACLVYGIGSMSKGGFSSLRLVLAGSAIAALMKGLNEGISLYYQVGQNTTFWYAAGVSRVQWEQILWTLPWFIASFIGAMILSKPLSLLSLGDEVAKGLGLAVGKVKLWSSLVVLVLAGIAVALVGGVGFVGLIIPHVVRKLVGTDYRLVIPCSAVLGALLVVLADLASRTINPPYEIPLASLTAALGVPFFLYLVRKDRGGI